MLLFVHILVGAILALKINFVPLALILIILSHYILDFLPHIEYSIINIQQKNWKKSWQDFLKISLDLTLGSILLILICKKLSLKISLALIGGIVAILPDFLTWLYLISPNKLLQTQYNFQRKLHLLKNKVSIFWKLIFSIIVVLLTIFLYFSNFFD